MAAPCGTIAGHKRHRDHDEDICQPCKDAWSAYQAQYRRDHPRGGESAAPCARACTFCGAEHARSAKALYCSEKCERQAEAGRNGAALFVRRYKAGKTCTDCGLPWPYYVLQFDHVPGRGRKRFNLSQARGGRSVDEVIAEIAKCDLVCANCHQIRTHERRTKPYQRRSAAIVTRPRLLDLFCSQGGAAKGYHDAGFDVTGVDIEPQPRYPFTFVQADAMTFPLVGFDAVHASPPCQDHSTTRDLGARHGTDWMLAATVDRLSKLPIPWVVENVKTAPLPHQPDLLGAYGLELCGCMFDELRGLLYEARVFQTSHPYPQPLHHFHQWPQTKMGRPPKPGECMQITGHFSDVPEGRRRMGIDWMTQKGLAQAIPPAYTEHIGRQLLDVLERAA